MREPRPAVQYLASIREHPYVQEIEARLRLACEPCAECGHTDWRELDDVLARQTLPSPACAPSRSPGVSADEETT